MHKFSRLSVLTLLFLGIVLMLVGGTADAQQESLTVEMDVNGGPVIIGTLVRVTFFVTPEAAVDLTISWAGFGVTSVIGAGGVIAGPYISGSVYTTDKDLGQLVIMGRIMSQGCTYVEALWPEGGNDGLTARTSVPGCIDIPSSLSVDSSVDDRELVEVGDEVTVRFFVDPPDEIPLHVSVKNVEVISIWGANDHHAPILPSNYTTNGGGELVVTGVFTGPGDAFIHARWDDPLPHSGSLTSRAFFKVRGPLPLTIQVFNKYKETFRHPDVHAFFPDVLNAFKDPNYQLFLNSVTMSRFVDSPRYIRNFYTETDDSILALLLLDGEFQTLFRDEQFHAVVRNSNEINRLIELINETPPLPTDPICPSPTPEPQPEPPKPTTLSTVSGNNQSGEVDKPLAQPFVVGVLDQEGKPLQGIAVTFRVTAGNGRLSATRQMTDVYGQARTTLTLGSGAGLHSVRASVSGIAQTQTFTATAIAPPPPPEPEPVVPVQPSTSEPSLPPMYWIEGNTIYYRPTRGTKTTFWEPRDGTLTGGLAVDTEGGKVYWTERTIDNRGRLRRADLDGTNVQTVKEIFAVPFSIAVGTDKSGKRWVYWTTSAKKIQRINVDGSGFQGNFMEFPQSPTPSNHIAFDQKEFRLYWTEMGRIRRVAANGTGKRDTIAEDLGEVRGITVFDDVVYWTEQTNGLGRVMSVHRADSGAKLLAVTESIPMGIAVDPVGGRVYWTTNAGNIQSVPIDAIQAVVTGGDKPIAGIALGGMVGVPAAPAAPSISPMVSAKNTLLANYPNPFNPETWIPYQLSAAADVSISIYSVNGHLVRRLELGHQAAGVYRSRSRAAYWDGRNAFGERVASGLYFYTLTVSDFTATRKMLIRK